MLPVGNIIEISPIAFKQVIKMQQPVYQKATVLQISPDAKLPFGANCVIEYVASQRIHMDDQVFLNTDFIIGYYEPSTN